MARPITWRNIAGPSFNNSALATAVSAFDRAGSGFGEVSDRLFETQQVIDDQYTNDAIRQSLATGQVNPNLNPRADATAVHEAVLGKRKAESDLLTAEVDRRADTATAIGQENENRVFDKRFAREREELDAQLERWEAMTESERANAKLRGAELRLAENEANLNQKAREGRDTVNDVADNLESRFYAEFAAEEGIEDGQSIDEATHTRLTAKARQKAQGEFGRSMARQEFQRLGLPEEAWANSIYGALDAETRAIESRLAESRQERLEIAREQGREAEYRASLGDFSQLIYDGSTLTGALDEATLKREKDAVSTKDKGLNILRSNGLRVDTWSDSDKELVEKVRQMFPTASAFTAIVQNYTNPNGSLRDIALRDASRQGAKAVLNRTRLRGELDLGMGSPETERDPLFDPVQQPTNSNRPPRNQGAFGSIFVDDLINGGTN